MASSDVAAAVAAAMRTEQKIALSLDPAAASAGASASASVAEPKDAEPKDASSTGKRKQPADAAADEQPSPSKKKKKAQTSSNWKKLRATLDAEPRRGRPKNFKRPRASKTAATPPTQKPEPTPSSQSAFARGSVSAADGKLTRLLALDCEMVGIGPAGREDALARVSVVNARGDVVYDTFVRVRQPVTDYRTEYSGVTEEDIAPDAAGAANLPDVRARVREIIAGRIVVGHALKNDFRALALSHPWKLTRDTAVYYKALWRKEIGRRSAAPPKLSTLAAQVLGVDEFQKGGHDSREDARAALALYKKNAKEWEASLVRKGRGGKGGGKQVERTVEA